LKIQPSCIAVPPAADTYRPIPRFNPQFSIAFSSVTMIAAPGSMVPQCAGNRHSRHDHGTGPHLALKPVDYGKRLVHFPQIDASFPCPTQPVQQICAAGTCRLKSPVALRMAGYGQGMRALRHPWPLARFQRPSPKRPPSEIRRVAARHLPPSRECRFELAIFRRALRLSSAPNGHDPFAFSIKRCISPSKAPYFAPQRADRVQRIVILHAR